MKETGNVHGCKQCNNLQYDKDYQHDAKYTFNRLKRTTEDDQLAGKYCEKYCKNECE